MKGLLDLLKNFFKGLCGFTNSLETFLHYKGRIFVIFTSVSFSNWLSRYLHKIWNRRVFYFQFVLFFPFIWSLYKRQSTWFLRVFDWNFLMWLRDYPSVLCTSLLKGLLLSVFYHELEVLISWGPSSPVTTGFSVPLKVFPPSHTRTRTSIWNFSTFLLYECKHTVRDGWPERTQGTEMSRRLRILT